MTNHAHFVITPHRAATVPKLIISLGRRYVQYINTSYRRTGTLWDSRYKFFAYTGRNIPAHLHALYRAQPRSGHDDGGFGALSLDKLSSQRARTTVAAVIPHSGLPFLLVRPPKHGKPPTVNLFRYHLDEEMISELRLAVNQSQPLGNERFYETIARMPGQPREARPRGRLA
jgi:REP-associated tyrosine transposase